MKLMWDSEMGFYELPIQMAHQCAWEVEEPWRLHGPFAFEVISELSYPTQEKDG